MELKITTLIENNLDDDGHLLCEHGLSLYIEADGKKILFDILSSFIIFLDLLTMKKEIADFISKNMGNIFQTILMMKFPWE